MPNPKKSSPALPASALDDLVQSIPEGIAVIDPAGQVTFFNHGAETISGWNSREALGKPIDGILPLSVGKGRFQDLLPAGGSLPHVNVLTRSGQEITLSLARTPLRSPDAAGRSVLVFRDVTEEESAQRLRSYFLANISHEFRTPLSALKASVELLLEEIGDLTTAETVELVKSLHFSVTGLQTLIDNLLESVSIEAGRFRIRRSPTDLHTVVVEAEKVMKPLLERRNQTLVIELQPDLPTADVDPMRLTQVLVNLISNASKYGPMDKPIELGMALQDENTLRVSVSDQGTGIPLEERANVFRRFIRLDEKDKAQYGIGLGLSVVKSIVEGHGGRVGLDGRPGGGLTFWFTLPLKGEA
ncbi:MAG TPA: ATP-binding protein [Anaerolineales bacterium]|nr:ATP-binding protein [Anaerolineales bacterium]